MRTRLMGVVNVTPDSFSRRRAVPRCGGGDRAWARAGAGTGRTSSTSVGNRRGRERRRSAPRRRSRGPSRSSPNWRSISRRPGTRSRSTPRSWRSPRPRSTPARRSSTTSPRCAAIPRSARSAPSASAGLILMHMQGDPRTMQENPTYDDVVDDVQRLPRRAARGGARRRGRRGADLARPRDRLRQDASSTTSSCCAASASCASLGRPLVVGTSRKSFIGKIDGSEVGERIGGTIASSILAAAEGADVLRVHDVAEVAQAARVAAAILG